MAQFNLSDTVDSSKVFLVKRSELEGNLDTFYYKTEFKNLINKILENKKFEFVKLKSVLLNLTDGAHLSPESNNIHNNNYITVKDIDNDGNIDLINCLKISDEDFNSLIKNGCQPNIDDVLFSKDGTVGKTHHVVSNNFVVLSSLAILTPNVKKVLPKYLEFLLRSDLMRKFIVRSMGGSALRRIVLLNLKELKIPLPKIETQQQIIDLYQTAYTQKQQKEAQSKELLASIDTYLLNELGITMPEKDTSLQSRIFTTMFSEVSGGRFESQYHTQYNKDVLKSIENSKYPIEKIKKHTQFIPGYAFSSDSYIEFSECYLITIKNISKNTIELENVTYLPNHFFEDYSKFQVNRNDLLIAMTGATIGKVGIYESDDKALLNQRNGIIKSKTLNTFYLMNLLNTEIYQSLILKNSVGGAQPNISETDITRISIPLPPPEKQTEIAKHIQVIRTQAKQLQEEAKTVLEKAKREVEKMILG